MNFQMIKLVLEKAEEPEIVLSTSGGLSKKQEIPENHQGASRAAPGKSGLHARGKGERVMAVPKN